MVTGTHTDATVDHVVMLLLEHKLGVMHTLV